MWAGWGRMGLETWLDGRYPCQPAVNRHRRSGGGDAHPHPARRRPRDRSIRSLEGPTLLLHSTRPGRPSIDAKQATSRSKWLI